MPRALITGASAGIGAEFARQLAARGIDLVLIARDRDRLELLASELRSRYAVTVEVLAADLVTTEGLAEAERRVATSTDPIDILVNNAGFGLRADFESTSLEDELRLLELLVTAPLHLSHRVLVPMLARGSGTIINIGSVAAYSPRGTYGAAKSWVLSFSRWAHVHYRDRGVRVTAVMPGFVRTEFHERMRVGTSTVPAVLWLSAERVVRLALRDVDRGRAVSIPTVRYRILVFLLRVLPSRWAASGNLRALDET
jgi:short-subunit dehydrogenase